MKKLLLISLLLICFSSLFAQDFQWAKSYSGIDGFNDGNSQSNYISSSAFDAHGNIYILGRFGSGARIGDEPILPEARLPSNYLAKLDSNGNLLWKKVLSNSAHDIKEPNWMEMVGDTSVAIMIEVYNPQMPYQYGYYLDTLIYGLQTVVPQDQWQIPYCPGRWTAFLQFDLDGNIVKENFLKWNCLDSNNQSVGKHVINAFTPAPFHIGKDGYIYIITDMNYNDYPLVWTPHFRLNVNGEDIEGSDFLIDTSNYNLNLSYKLFKFTPNFDLVWHKDIFMDTIGGCSEYEFWTQLTGISTDEEDNIYLTGTIYNGFEPTMVFPTSSPYILEFMLDSIHSIKIKDISNRGQSFIIKYDTSGVVKWVNQPYSNFTQEGATASADFSCSTISGDNVFVFAAAKQRYTYLMLSEEDTLDVYNDRTSRCFFVKYNKTTGEFASHGIVRNDTITFLSSTAKPSITVKNNQVFAQVEVNSTSSNHIALIRWLDTGELIETINIASTSSYSSLNAGQTILDNNGNLFLTGKFDNSITFGETTLYSSGSNSGAFFAKYHDPSFSVPYESGIEDINSVEYNNIFIYPNPTKDKTMVFSNGENIKLISIYNMSGQIIFKQSGLNTAQTNIDLSTYSNGIYLIKVVTDKKVYSNKIILTK